MFIIHLLTFLKKISTSYSKDVLCELRKSRLVLEEQPSKIRGGFSFPVVSRGC